MIHNRLREIRAYSNFPAPPGGQFHCRHTSALRLAADVADRTTSSAPAPGYYLAGNSFGIRAPRDARNQ